MAVAVEVWLIGCTIAFIIVGRPLGAALFGIGAALNLLVVREGVG